MGGKWRLLWLALILGMLAGCAAPPEVPMEEEEVKPESATCQYRIEGMMCKHCVGRVERALNTIERITKVTVTLEPPVAIIVYEGEPLSVEELQDVLTEKAGDYRIAL